MALATWERKHGPRSRSHVPCSGNVYVPRTGMFLFPRYKMIPQVSVPVPRTETGTWLLRSWSRDDAMFQVFLAYVSSISVVSDVCFNYFMWMLQK
jgi:hypothetical protein